MNHNIMMITSDYTPSFSGVGRHVEELTQELVRNGYNITVFVYRGSSCELSPEYYETIYSKNLKVVEIPAANHPHQADRTYLKYGHVLYTNNDEWWITEYQINFIEYVLEYLHDHPNEKFDLIHAHNALYAVSYVMLKKYLQVPLISTIHSISTDKIGLKMIQTYFLINNSTKSIFVSNNLRNMIPIANDDNSVVIYNGNTTNELPNTLDHKFTILYCTRLLQRKGAQITIDIFKTLKKKLPPSRFQFIVAGNGPYESKFRDISEEDNTLNFVGQLNSEEIIEMYRKCDITIIPSRKESFCLVAQEAMLNGSFVIAFELGCLKELIPNNDYGILLPLVDDSTAVNLFVDEILKVYYREYNIKRIQENAHRRMVELCDWKNTFPLIEKIYMENML